MSQPMGKVDIYCTLYIFLTIIIIKIVQQCLAVLAAAYIISKMLSD